MRSFIPHTNQGYIQPTTLANGNVLSFIPPTNQGYIQRKNAR